jgi:methyl-accepting chemotaxis protein
MDPTIFVAVTSAAVVLQAFILVALYLAVRKVSAKVESLADEIKDKALPLIGTVSSMLVDSKPKIESVVEDVSSTTAMVRAQIERIDATLTDVVDRTRLQVIRADEMVNHTMDRIEETGEIVRKSVISPVRQISGVVRGVSTGFEVLFGARRRRRNGNGVTQDEMFI